MILISCEACNNYYVSLHCTNLVGISTQENQRFAYLKGSFLFPPFFVILIDYANSYCTNRCFPNNSWSFLFVTFISSACSSFYCVWPSVVLNGGYFPRGDSNSLSSIQRIWSISFQNALQLLKECNILALKILLQSNEKNEIITLSNNYMLWY